MNFDQQLVLGIVFIIAGIAVALLAYAAYLNREQRSVEEEQAVAESDEETPQAAMDEEIRAAPSAAAPHAESTATERPVSSPAAAEVQGPQSEPEPALEPAEPETRVPAAASAGPHESDPAAPGRADTPPVRLKRSPESGRLNVEVGDRVYSSIEDLRASPDWPKVDDLFSDILAWLIKEQPNLEDLGPLEESPPPDRPLSMVEQINQILKEKLEERQEGPRAVRLIAGSDGTVRVYIGMDSYPLDEVPDEEVQAIIRQAVKEWEARQ